MTVVLRPVAELFHPYPHHRVSATASASAPPLQGGVCGLRNAGTNTRTPASSASSAFGHFAEVAEGKREPTNHGPNVPGLNTGAIPRDAAGVKRFRKKFLNRTAEVGGSRKLSHELVKTLIAFSPIVNFPAQGSQSPMFSHFSNTHLNFYVLKPNLV